MQRLSFDGVATMRQSLREVRKELLSDRRPEELLGPLAGVILDRT